MAIPFALAIQQPLGDSVSICIVIPSKYQDIFVDCHKSLEKFAPNVRKILVRDGDEIQTPLDPSWTVVQGAPGKFVYARNINLGVVEALKDPQVDRVLLMNDDVQFLHDNTVENMRGAMLTNPEIGILSPGIDGNACNPLQCKDGHYPKDSVQVVDGDFVTFVCVMISREVFEKIGFLDEIFTGYGSDDVDFCRRAKISGFKLAVTTVSEVRHGFGKHRSSASYIRYADQDQMAEDNRNRYTEKWGRRTEGAFQDEGHVLIAIRSCVRDAKRGDNQASRDTWLKDVKYYGYDYKFFIGDGTPTGEVEPKVTTEWGWQYKGRKQESISEIVPKTDEEILHCPDDYFHMSYKLREICRYAVRNKFDYIFTPCDDVYVDVYRLRCSGFEGHDYVGNFWNNNPYAHGGPGFWLSKKAFTILANANVTSTHDDDWTGKVMSQNDIKGHHDTRYAYDSDVIQNDTISLHLTYVTGSYQVQWMYDIAKKWPITVEKEQSVDVTKEIVRTPVPISVQGRVLRNIPRTDGRIQRRVL